MNEHHIIPFSLRRSILSIALMTAFNHPVLASEVKNPISHSDFGGAGLMQMPNGRFLPEGTFSVGGRVNEVYHHYFVSAQIMPWLESTIRYTRTPSVSYSSDEDFSGDNIHTDKGIDVKFRLLEESYWLPEVGLGFRDIAGTGLFDSEFIAASKRTGNFDFTIGIAWGYLGNSNNFGHKTADNIDCGRGSDFQGNGGIFEFGRFFSGCKSVFAGVSYQASTLPLEFKMEYDSNDYRSDLFNRRNKVKLVPKSPINLGLTYQLDEWGDFSIMFERGDSVSLGLSLHTNFNSHQQEWVDNKAPLYAPQAENKVQNIDWQNVGHELADNAGYTNAKIYADDDHIRIEATQTKYRNRDHALGRAATILANTGSTATTYSITEQNTNLHINNKEIDVDKYKRFKNQEDLNASLTDSVNLSADLPKWDNTELVSDNTEDWSFHVSPTLQQSFGGSEGFYLFNVGVSGSGTYWLNDHFAFTAGAYLNLYDNYNKFLYDVPPDGTDLKRVRTLVRQYITDQPLRLNNLQLTGFEQFGNNIYTQSYAGYLESMFAGVGGEILYREMGSHWAFGLDVNYVKQRDPNNIFGVFNEEVQYDDQGRRFRVQTGAFTGHASVYYNPQWELLNNITVKMHAGRYLADDLGATLDISKQFDSGVIIGAHVTKTNLSAEEYGEGSFNKGFYVSLPLDVFTIKPTTSRASVGWNPLTRDGGQMLGKKYSLFDLTSAKYPDSELTNK